MTTKEFFYAFYKGYFPTGSVNWETAGQVEQKKWEAALKYVQELLQTEARKDPDSD